MHFNFERIFKSNKAAAVIGLGLGVAIVLLAPFYFYPPLRSYPARIYSCLTDPRSSCRLLRELAFAHGREEPGKGSTGKGYIVDLSEACQRIIGATLDAAVFSTGAGVSQKTQSQEISPIPGVAVRGRFAEVRASVDGAAGIPGLVRAERLVTAAVLRSGGVVTGIRHGRGMGFEMEIGIEGRLLAMTVPMRVMTLSVRLEGIPGWPAVEGGREAARLAIIIDDVGYNLGELEKLMELGRPLTVAVLPHAPFAAESARRAKAGGLEVLLHLPMEPLNRAADPGPYAVRCDMPGEEIRRVVLDNLDRVPGAAGANNHMGSRATADLRVMKEVLSVLADRGLLFIDSRTAPGSVAVEAASAVNMGRALPGIRLAVNDGFIDNQADPASIKRQIRLIEGLALRHGSAICIGHLRRTTIQALREMIPEFEKAGVRLVHVSELVH